MAFFGKKGSSWTAADIEAIRRSGLFNADFYLARRGQRSPNPIEDYLREGEHKGIPPSAMFDPLYYRLANPDVAAAGASPLLHYIRYGWKEGRPPNRFATAPLPPIVAEPPPDAESFGARLTALPGLKHLFHHAKGEPRRNQPHFAEEIPVETAHAYDSNRQTVLIVNHDASRTGAPLVGLEIARHLCDSHNVFIYCQREGELIEAFGTVAVQVNVGSNSTADAEFFLEYLRSKHPVDAVILNSAETAPFAAAALHGGVPSVALIHEFAEYTFPTGKAARMVAAVDRVVVPANLVLESLQRDLQTQFGSTASNIVVRPQGCLPVLPQRHTQDTELDFSEQEILARLGSPDKRPPIVLGGGFVHMRKGVELFIQTAHEVRREIPDVRFIWVGAGYAPTRDVNYSVWLSETIRRLGLENTVLFLPPQSQLDDLFALSRVFFLSSRLDPFPSVVLDAFEAGKQVVCFDRATGAAELFQSGAAKGAAVEYANVNQAARAIVDIITADDKAAGEANHRLVLEKFRFADYVAVLKDQVATAQKQHAQLRDITSRILASNTFDADFHEGSLIPEAERKRACREYVSRHLKGLSKFNPRPGFSDNLYKSRTGIAAGTVPLEHALKSAAAGELPATHKCVELTGAKPSRPRPRTALHLHMHYPDLAEDFVRRLTLAACPIDLFVTTTDRKKRALLKEEFSGYTQGSVTYIEVENRGRDIGPFLTHIGSATGEPQYDVVGHLHAKRSAAVDSAMGDRWRHYLLQTLLGESLAQLLDLFAQDERLGLVFPEDRHVVGWDKNHELAKQLAERIKPRPVLPALPHFPLGTMFWARRAALEPLWNAGFKTEDFPREPVPYDGTTLHAMERMLPSCVEAAGYSWCTVYEPGLAW